MSTTRINAVSATATTFAGDDFLPIDGNVNATRRILVTSLFASPSAIGSVTPAAGAFTTGTFSSTLDVTGVATLGNGAILGTPASGTVTNLTGTASININGTVGATTPSTVAATTVAATGAITTSAGNITALAGELAVGSSSKLINLRTLSGNNRIDSYDNPITATVPLVINASTTTIGSDTSTVVINSTGLAVTGALSASGSATFGNTSTPSTSVGGTQINNPLSVGPSIFSQANAAGNRWIDFMGSSTTVASLNNNSGVFSIAAAASGAEINVSGTQRGLFSSTGLAVTGALSATTGGIFATSSGSVGIGTSSPSYKLEVKGDASWFRNFAGAPASPSEVQDWPIPAVNIASYGDFTLQTMLAFTLPNDGNYFTDYSVWNFKLNQAASSTTSAGVSGMEFGGRGYLAFLPTTFVGIGTASPAVKLHVQSGSTGATALRLTDAARATLNVDFPASSQVRFDVGAAEKTLFSSGTNTILTINDTNGGGGIVVAGGVSDTAGNVRILVQNSQSAAYTLVLGDSGKHILHPSADTTARTFTIPANGTVAFTIGTAVTFINQNGGGVITISITTDTMRLAGAGTTGSRTLAANGVATAVKITSTEWIISGTGLT